MDNKEEFNWTPEETAKELIKLVPIVKGDRFYEPFKGRGAFYDLMPEPKDWSEIGEGKDFLTYEGKCEHIITNPPWNKGNEGLDINTIVNKCFEVSTKSVNLLLSSKALNFMTPKRLTAYEQRGWTITAIHILNVKKWYGRYFFIQFRKDTPSIITWHKED